MVAQTRHKFNDSRKNQSRHVFTDGNRTAGVRFGDTLRSTRSTSGIQQQSKEILFSEAILTQARRDGITQLEVIISDRFQRETAYRVALAEMLERGELQRTPAGTQRGLSLDAWQTSRRAAVTPSAPTATSEPTPAPQMTLFAEVAR
jgi:hypothetical protein